MIARRCASVYSKFRAELCLEVNFKWHWQADKDKGEEEIERYAHIRINIYMARPTQSKYPPKTQ